MQLNMKKRKSALITGAGRGIGQAIARRLAADGYYVLLVSRTKSELDNTLKIIHETKGEGESLVCDVSDQHAVNTLVMSIEPLDILINNAGCSGGGHTAEMDDELWHRMMAVNLNSVYYFSKAVLHYKKIQQPGSIINIASTGGKQGVIYGAAYSASKSGVIGFSKALGLELAKQNITVNAVCPGFVETSLSQHVRESYANLWNVSLEETKQRIETRIPIGRYILAEEVAEMVKYLVSPAARGITAQAINLCGGLGSY